MRLARHVLRRPQPPAAGRSVPASVLELARSGAADLVPLAPPRDRPLQIAVLIPSFRRGSGGHATIVNLARALAERGHLVSLWLEDFLLQHVRDDPATVQARFVEYFGAGSLGLATDFGAWRGADVVLATGWQTVARALLLPGVAARAYLVQDHEPEFYGASAESLFAVDTYRRGLRCVAASEWLAQLLQARYGATASHFDLAVDHSIYRPRAAGRRQELVVFYARETTGRRAVPLGLLALEELSRRRPEVEISLYGNEASLDAPFPHTSLGVMEPTRLARLYGEATVGMVFSLTNPSLANLEMMACGLPCVELATDSMRACFGAEGPLRLVEPDPIAICRAVERLLEDGGDRARRSAAGLELVRSRTWSAAAEQVEAGIRAALG